MQQKEYHLIVHSEERVIIVISLIMFTFVSIFKKYVPNIDNDSAIVLLIFPMLAIAFFIAHLLGHAKAKIIFTDDAYIHIWKRKYFLSWQKDMQIPWTTINSYKLHDWKYFQSFTINHSPKHKRYSITQLICIPIKDDRDKMIRDFIEIQG